MRRLTVASTVIIVLAGCAAPSEEPALDEIAERAAVEGAITDRFESGIAKVDTAAVGRYLTPTFQSLEDSVWYDRDGFLEFVASLPDLVGAPFTLTYTLSDWRTTVGGDVAWTSLRNHAVVVPENADPFTLDWRETVVLRKMEGNWLIDRYHSAPAR